MKLPLERLLNGQDNFFCRAVKTKIIERIKSATTRKIQKEPFISSYLNRETLAGTRYLEILFQASAVPGCAIVA